MGDLTKPAIVRHYMNAFDFFFKKKLGQNFLIDENIAGRIVDAVLTDNPSCVLEVGPGLGALTELITDRGFPAVAVEIDPFAVKMLTAALEGRTNLKIVKEDILKCDIPALMDGYGTDIAAVSNLPYYVSSRILGVLFESRLFTKIVVMMQKELADRLTEEISGKRHSAFGLFCDYHADIKKLFDVPRSVFMPAPNVDSAVLVFTPRTKPNLSISIEDEDFLLDIIKKSFAMKRKTIANCLAAGYSMSRQDCEKRLAIAGIDPMARAETLDLAAFARLANAFRSKESNS